MRSDLIALPIVLPLLGGAISIVVGRWGKAQRVVGVTTLTAVLGISVMIMLEVHEVGPIATQGGGWAAPLGISLVADRLSALMMVVASCMLLAVMVYAIGQPGAERNHVGFQSVYLILAGGVSSAFLAGDLFNLFVAIEVMLTASYVLITLGGSLNQVRSGMTYVVTSLLASTLFIVGLAFIYSATGTMNLADLHHHIALLPSGTQSALAALFLVVFGIKAGLAPLYFWLPDSYPTAPSPVTAIFAGLLTKVGFYAIMRTQTLLFPGVLPSWLIMAVTAATVLIGVFGAVAQDDIKRILSFHIISQIGFMMIGLALNTVVGLAGAMFYIVHHIVVKTTLFLTGGLIEHHANTSSMTELSVRPNPPPTIVSIMYLLPALSLAGIPPFSGFVAKFTILSAAVDSQAWFILTVAVVASLFTLYSMIRIWVGVFGERTDTPDDTAEPAPVAAPPLPLLMVLPTAVLVVATIMIGLLGNSLYDYAIQAAENLLQPTAYLEAVGITGPSGVAP